MSCVRYETVGRWVVVRFVSDRLTDPATIAAASEQLAIRLHHLPMRGKVVIDFGAVQFVSSQVIGLLLAVRDRVVNHSYGTLVLARVGGNVREVLRLTKIDRQFVIKPTLEEVIGPDRAAAPLATVETRGGGRDVQWMG